MIDFAFVTTMNRDYYNLCGSNMIQSYLQYANHIPLFVYNEDFTIDAPVHQLGWDLGKDYNDFLKRWSCEEKHRVVTFGKKGFSVIHAMHNIQCNKLIWVDADCIFKKHFDLELLESISGPDIVSTHLSVCHLRDSREYHSCETGFFILNKKHPGFDRFCKTYTEIYTQDQTENLRRFYDGDVYGETVNRLPKSWMNNLNSNRYIKTPFKRSVLHEYLSHFKSKSTKVNNFQ